MVLLMERFCHVTYQHPPQHRANKPGLQEVNMDVVSWSSRSQRGRGLLALHSCPPAIAIPPTSPLPLGNRGQTAGRAICCCSILYKAAYRDCG